MLVNPYKVDIGAYQYAGPVKDKTKENKNSIGAAPGAGKPTDVLVQGRRHGSYSTGPSTSKRNIVL